MGTSKRLRLSPEFSRADMDEIRIGPELHALGINYYLGKVIRDFPESPLPYEAVRLPGEQVNGLGWSICIPPIYPEGLRLGLGRIHDRYRDHGLPPLYITENGYAGHVDPDPETGEVDDANRIAYFHEHLRQLAAAIEDGVPLAAYFAWTLMDNYEWAEGYRDESRFGIVHVSRPGPVRTPKASARWFQRFLECRRGVPAGK